MVTNNETLDQVHTISMFIINNKGEMLLTKKSANHLASQYQWSAPCFVHTDNEKAPQETAQDLLTQHGLHCELYEVFSTGITSQTIASSGEHIIIALATEPQTVSYQNDTYKWAQISKILQEVHDYPSRYVPWFRTALDGVILYLKSHLKTQTPEQFFIQFEL